MGNVRVLRAVVFAVVLCVVSSSRAGRPLAIDDADPVEKGMFEFEAGLAYERDPGTTHWELPFGLTYGLVRNVEVGFAFCGQMERRKEFAGTMHESGIGDLEMGAKWLFLESCPLGAQHALVPGVKVPTADKDRGFGSEETDYDLTWVVSRKISERFGAHLNLGYNWVGGPDHDVVHGGMALDYQLVASVQWVGEVFAEDERASDAESVAACNTGLRWSPIETLTLDMAAGTKICGDAPDITATAGLTWAFGAEI